MVRLDDINIFTCIADNASFSAASRVLGISPAVASASVKRLEHALGTQLFIRSTRSLSLTQAGMLYLEHAKTALDSIKNGASAIALLQGQIGGRLSISAPSDLGRGYLRKVIDGFQDTHPAIEIKMMLSDRMTDLYKSQVDIAIRYGLPSDSGLIATPLVSDNRRIICAAPAYFAAFGKPKKPADLAAHNCLCFALNDIVHNKWQFGRGDTMQIIAVKGNRISDDGDLVRQWAVAGKGIAYKSKLDVLDELRTGQLEPALEDFATEAAPLNIISAQRLSSVPAAAALISHLTEAFKQYVKPAA